MTEKPKLDEGLVKELAEYLLPEVTRGGLDHYDFAVYIAPFIQSRLNASLLALREALAKSECCYCQRGWPLKDETGWQGHRRPVSHRSRFSPCHGARIRTFPLPEADEWLEKKLDEARLEGTLAGIEKTLRVQEGKGK